MDYIIKYDLWTLLKQGTEEALALLGYKHNPDIIVSEFRLDSYTISVGESLLFSVIIETKENVYLMIDYIIYFRTKRETFSTTKVYNLKKLVLKQGEKVTLKKKHLFKAKMTTRTFYEGEHRLELQLNGIVVENEIFKLII